MNEELKEIVGEFILESKELLEIATADMLAFEKEGSDELINNVFRGIHTIKGTSSFLNFNNLSRLAHVSEDLLGKIKKKEIEPRKEVIDSLLKSFDMMKMILENIETMGDDQVDIKEILSMLEDISKGGSPAGGQIGEMDETQSVSEEEKEEGIIAHKDQEKFTQRKKAQREEQTIRIDVKKLDDLMNLVGELVLGKNRLMVLSQSARVSGLSEQVIENLSEVTNYIELVTNELQLSVMKARLVPISRVFSKIPRMVRELCNEFKKEVELEIKGEETELDKSLIEVLHDPMVHIVRNSIDHGIETPEERVAKGKMRKGLLSISARNEGNHIIIEVFDDGKGIDTKAIKEKVKEKGLIGEEELNSMSEKEIMNLVFLPGLSTAKTVTKVSGRGVGMDVVKTNIERLNGQVCIDSEFGRWTKLTLKLPLTLAIMKSLVIEKDGELYAVPLNTVVELVKAKEEDIKFVDKKEVLVLRDRVIPVLDLSYAFGRNGSKNGRGYLVICNVDDKSVAVKVDHVVGQEEVVIKPLGEFLGNVGGIGGATIRGDGRVILILDIPSLIRLTSSHIREKRV
jgi:two-component system chemotaxis sensor kinase CheA